MTTYEPDVSEKKSRERTLADLPATFVRKRPEEILAEINATLEAYDRSVQPDTPATAP